MSIRSGDAIKVLPDSYNAILQEAKKIIADLKSWKNDGNYTKSINPKKPGVSGNVQVNTVTANSKLEGVHWSSRKTTLSKEHRQLVYTKLSKYLLGSFDIQSTHTHYEKEYIHDLEEFKVHALEVQNQVIDEIETFNSFAYTTQVVYKLQFPLSKRVFHELVCIFESKADNIEQFYVVSIPIVPSLYSGPAIAGSTGCTKATYASVEYVSYDNREDDLQWIMCTCANPGGLVPRYLADKSLSKVISHDVPLFLEWAQDK